MGANKVAALFLLLPGLFALSWQQDIGCKLSRAYPSDLPQSVNDAPELHVLNVQVSFGKAGALNAKAAIWTGAAAILGAASSMVALR